MTSDQHGGDGATVDPESPSGRTFEDVSGLADVTLDRTTNSEVA